MMEVSKEIIIDAICGGVIIPMEGINRKITPIGGNQWCPGRYWNREELEKMDENELIKLYTEYRHKNDD